MKTKNNLITGIIQGKPKDSKFIEEYMLSTINTIKSEIENKFSKYKKDLYIYYKYNSNKRIFNIFVVIFKKQFSSYKRDITYLIAVGEEYPKIAPKVFCISKIHDKIDIFDMRNIQKNIIEQWKQKHTVNDLISGLLNFADIIIFQADNKLFPNIGEYHYNSYIYDLNDFLLNKNNIFFRVYYFSNKENSADLNKNERYMLITKNTIIFFANSNEKLKNLCIIEFKFELTWINELKSYPVKKYPDYTFFEFIWNNHSNYLHKFVFGTKNEKGVVSKIKDCVIDRKRFLLDNYKYFEKFNDNDVETLEKIIYIKEKYLEMTFSRNLYYQVHKIYRNIINIFNSMNDEGYKKYVDKLQAFISKFEGSKKKNQ